MNFNRGMLLCFLLSALSAQAYPWMIQHGYVNCITCHVDPSGATLLTPYGKAQSDLLLRTHYGNQSESEEPSGSVSTKVSALLPDWLNAGASFRGGLLEARQGSNLPGGAAATDSRLLLMQAEARAAANVGAFRSYVSVGIANLDPKTAAIFGVSPSTKGYLISREHWIGFEIEDTGLLIRAGRMDLPFGLRNIEHNTFVRSYTRTDINGQQQHGASISYNGDKWRGEVMGILGNYQIAPDDYRERGYAAFAEYRLAEKATLGASALTTSAALDLLLQKALLRQSYGVFGRWSPLPRVALLLESDLLFNSADPYRNKLGYVGWFQPDWEIIQGLHFMPALEWVNDRSTTAGTSIGGWLSTVWYFAPQSEFRIDYTYRHLANALAPIVSHSILLQLHFFL